MKERYQEELDLVQDKLTEGLNNKIPLKELEVLQEEKTRLFNEILKLNKKEMKKAHLEMLLASRGK